MSLPSSVEDYLILTGGILLQSKNQYESAMKLFSSVIDSQKLRINNESNKEDMSQLMNAALSTDNGDNRMLQGTHFSFLTEGMSDHTILSTAVNNFAVCAVFLKKIELAMTTLENVLQAHPGVNMSDALVFNLCTIYDLSFSPDISTNKKKMIQRIASFYSIENINWRSFRLA